MLKKFIAIKNTGKFRNCNAAGDIEFRKLSLIYAENGRGKTTLSAVLRSLQAGDPLFITERKTLDGNGPPLVEILTDQGKVSFTGTAWTQSYPDLAVFDSTYVSENVYSGDFVEHDHKKRLYQVTIGKDGVALALKVNECDGKGRDLASQLKGKREELAKKIPKGTNLEVFLALPEDDQIEQKIALKQGEIAVVAGAEAIKAKGEFRKLVLPAMPDDLESVLAQTLDDVSKDAETRIRQQIENHQMGDGGQNWLSLGLNFVHADACPFCEQSVRDNNLIATYRSFFSASYRDFKDRIRKSDEEFRRAFSEKLIAGLKTILVQNSANQEFWKQYISVELPELDFEAEIEPALKNVAHAMAALLDKKSAAPLDVISFSDATQSTVAVLVGISPLISAYNAKVDEANAAIVTVKKKSETANGAILKKDLAQLELQKTRHLAENSAICIEIQQFQDQKKAIEADKDKFKEKLDEHADQVFQQSETGINKLLERFSAGFRLAGVKQQYLGGSPSSTFKLSINGVAIELGDPSAPRGIPCFRNTMSSGDRNTLAFAFFIVQLQQRPDLANLTVVFDDPFTSLDRFRQQFTRDQIRALAKKAKQVIVLSHEPSFLELIADGFEPADLRLLIVARDGVLDSVIKPWDMKTEMAPGYHKDIGTLLAYYGGEWEDSRAVIRCIRPVLEGFLRMSFPGSFPDNAWLGGMLEMIRDCAAGAPLEAAKASLSDLESLNDYTKRYHHDDNSPKQGQIPIQDAELQQFAKLSLQIIGRL